MSRPAAVLSEQRSAPGCQRDTPFPWAPPQGDTMQRNHILAALVAAVFAIPLASANTGKTGDKSASAASTQSSAGMANDGGAEAMFKALDKNNDGFLSKDEVKGSAHEAEFDKLDTNHDGKLSRAE